MSDRIKLNIGSGGTKIPGFISVDKYYPNADIKSAADDTGFSENTVSEIYTSHMIEHLTIEEAILAIKHWYKILHPGGIVNLLCPNAIVYIREWLKHYIDNDYDQLTGWAVRNLLGWNNKGIGMYNKMLYTPKLLESLFCKVGFKIVSCKVQSTRVKDIRHIEYRENGDISLTARK